MGTMKIEMKGRAVRPAVVAGMFYPARPDVLTRDMERMLAAVRTGTGAERPPKALIVPHAGYPYSGPIAAEAYSLLRGARGLISRVVLLGPAHRVYVQGAALSSASSFGTPLGEMRVDQRAHEALQMLPFVGCDDEAHAMEHALEVQLPFLRSVLGDIEIVPIVVGRASPAEVAQVLSQLWGGPETLIVISSDLSHYHGYAEARRHDQNTVQRILRYSEDLTGEEACGASPLNGFLRVARARKLAPRVLDLRNSGDTAGDRARVVGYCAIAYDETSDTRGTSLLGEARDRIADALGMSSQMRSVDDSLNETGATFVTLTRDGELRGCVGSLTATRSLREDVRSNAFAAAFQDPRFTPLTRTEFAHIAVEVSLVGELQPLDVADEADAMRLLRAGIDGLIFEAGGRRATFLPQVWEQLPHPRDFLAALKRKAGFPADYWGGDVRLSRYTVQKWRES